MASGDERLTNSGGAVSRRTKGNLATMEFYYETGDFYEQIGHNAGR
jgi:hypothetical protein